MKKIIFFTIIISMMTFAVNVWAFPPSPPSPIGTLTDTKWCYATGGKIVCTANAPAGIGDVLASGAVPVDFLDFLGTGVRIIGLNGTLTFLGLGDGFDEDLILDFNSVTNTVTITSASGVTLIDFADTIGIEAKAYKSTVATGTPPFVVNSITEVSNLRAATATALAANGANCNAGQAPLGVDASGAVEGCYAVLPATALDDTKGNGDTAYIWSADKVYDQLVLKQNALTGYSDIVSLWASGKCTGFLYSDGTCTTPVGTALTDGKIWIGSSKNVPTEQTLTGDVTMSDAGLTAIGGKKILQAMINDNVVAAGQLAIILTFPSTQSIDLSAITLTGAQDYGLSIPNWVNVAPTSDKNWIAIDRSLNALKFYNGGWVTVQATGAPTTPQYLLLDYDATLSAERKFTAGLGLTATDAGANSTYTIDVDLTKLVANQVIFGGDQASRTITFNLSGTDPVLTLGNSVFNISTGTLQQGGVPVVLSPSGAQVSIAGPTQARIMTVPDAAFTVARTDAANTFTGIQTMTSPDMTTPVVVTSIAPKVAGASTLGTTSYEWGNIYLTDSAVIYGQADQSNSLTSAATGWTANLLFTGSLGFAAKNGTSGGFVDFYEPSGGGTSKIRLIAPALAADVTLTLPIALAGGANYLVNSDASGNLGYTAPNTFATAANWGGSAASPPALGTGTPAAGTFTTLVAGSANSLTVGASTPTKGSIIFYGATSGTAVLAAPDVAGSATAIVLPSSAGTLQLTNGSPAGFVITSQAQGDILYASSATAWARLGQSTQYKFLITNGASANPSWSAYTMPSDITTGDIVYGSGSHALSALASSTGSQGSLLRLGASTPAWTTLTMPTTIAAGSVFAANTSNTLTAITSASGTYFLKNIDGTISWATGVGTIGGSTGSTDNAILRADGTGGVTIQSSGVVIDDTGNLNLPTGASLQINGVNVYSAGSNGTYYLDFGNNTSAYTPTSGHYRMLFASGVPELDINANIYPISYSTSAGSVLFTGPTVAQTFTVPSPGATSYINPSLSTVTTAKAMVGTGTAGVVGWTTGTLTLGTALTTQTGTVTLTGNAANTSELILPAGQLTLAAMAGAAGSWASPGAAIGTGTAVAGTFAGLTLSSGDLDTGNGSVISASLKTGTNSSTYTINIPVTGTDSGAHAISLQIDGNSGLSIAATGDGAGGVGARTISIGVTAAADIIHIGDANALVDITDAHWSITEAGVGNFTASTVTVANTNASADLLTIGGSAITLDGNDVYRGAVFTPGTVTASSTGNTITGLTLGNLGTHTNSTGYGLSVGTGYDYGIYNQSPISSIFSTSTATKTHMNLSITETATAGGTLVGVNNVVAHTGILTATTALLYGSYNSITKTGADTNAAEIDLYGVYGVASNTGATDAGTKITYGGYFSATGDSAGTSTAYGLYSTATGADTNYAGYFSGDVLVASGSFGLSGSISAPAWTTNGIRYKNIAATLTDTTSSGTVAAGYTNSFGGNTIAASSATVFTDYVTMAILPPTATGNASFTRAHTLAVIDSTSAASSITGGLIVATTLGTAATSVGIGGGNINAGGTITAGSTVTVNGDTVSIGTASTTTGGIKLYAKNTAYYSGINGNSNGSASYQWVMPAADAAGFIQSNGSGQLSVAAITAAQLPAAITPTTIELGHASDTTLSRVSAGVIAIEGKTVAVLDTNYKTDTVDMSSNLLTMNNTGTANAAAFYATNSSSTQSTSGTTTMYGFETNVTKSGTSDAANMVMIGVSSIVTYAPGGGMSGKTADVYGGYFSATGDTSGTSTAYGIKASASGASTNWAGYFVGGVYSSGTITAASGFSGLTAAQVPAPTTTVSSGSISVTTNNTYVVCTTTCDVTPLAPAAGVQLCVRNAPGSATVITLHALGSSKYYEKQDRSGWAATDNHTMTSSGAATDQVCIVGYDTSHYMILNAFGMTTN